MTRKLLEAPIDHGGGLMLTTLPGDIPGILLRGSPINVNGGRSVVVAPELHWVAFATKTALNIAPIADVTLDLTDPTGRAHAAWWFLDRWHDRNYPQRVDHYDRDDIRPALYGGDMTHKQIDTLARLVLRLAGRTP